MLSKGAQEPGRKTEPSTDGCFDVTRAAWRRESARWQAHPHKDFQHLLIQAQVEPPNQRAEEVLRERRMHRNGQFRQLQCNSPVTLATMC
eukprot:3687481-Amphidinium_carterae.2